MAELRSKDGQTKIVPYNVAAKIYQIQQGNLKEIADLDAEKRANYKKLAKVTAHIDWEKTE